MPNTSVTYEGTGALATFSVPFPYILTTHVEVELNGVTQATPADYTWPSATTIQFNNAPVSGASIVIRRVTPGDERLVDFTNGAVLTEADLNLAMNQIFYLAQETKENLTSLINGEILRIGSGNGIVETDPEEILAGLVNEMIASESAATIAARITDIDQNAEDIINNLGIINDEILDRAEGDDNLQTQINQLVEATAASVFVQAGEPVPGVGGIPDPIPFGSRWYDSDDNNHPYIYDDVALEWIDLEDPRIGQNAADIVALEAAMTTAQGNITTNATAISVLDTTVADLDDTVVAIAADVTTLESQMTTANSNIAANASAISSLQTTVTSHGSSITSISSAVTALETTVNHGTTGVAALNSAVSVLDTRIDANDSSISSLSSSVTALNAEVDLRAFVFAQAASPTAYNTGDLWIETDNANKLYRWNGTSWVAIDNTAIAANASAISTLQSTVSSHGTTLSSHATSLTNLSASITTLDGDIDAAVVNISANASAITDLESGVTTLEAKYGVTLNVGGYITGFAQHNNGSSGTFDILTDKFRVVDPASGGQNPTTVFAIESGNVLLQNLYLHQLTVGATGHIKRGKTSAADTTSGFWLGYDGTGNYDFHIGDATSYLRWDGSAATMTISGTLQVNDVMTALRGPFVFSTTVTVGAGGASYYGYQNSTFTGGSAVGSMTKYSFFDGYLTEKGPIAVLHWNIHASAGIVELSITDTFIENSDRTFSSITIAGIGTLNRSSAGYTGNNGLGMTVWGWSSQNTSGASTSGSVAVSISSTGLS